MKDVFTQNEMIIAVIIAALCGGAATWFWLTSKTKDTINTDTNKYVVLTFISLLGGIGSAMAIKIGWAECWIVTVILLSGFVGGW